MALVGVGEPPDGSTVTPSTDGFAPETVKVTFDGFAPMRPMEIGVPLISPHN